MHPPKFYGTDAAVWARSPGTNCLCRILSRENTPWRFPPSARSAAAHRCSPSTRIDDKAITDRSEVVSCDCAVVLDDTLFGDGVKKGLKPGATVIINTTKDKSQFAIDGVQVVTVDATGLALEILGRPITNVPLLVLLIAATGITSVSAVEAAIDDQAAPKAAGGEDKKLLNKTYEIVKAAL